MVQFLSIIFFSWISSIFVGFFTSSRFLVSTCICISEQRFHTVAFSSVHTFFCIRDSSERLAQTSEDRKNTTVPSIRTKLLLHGTKIVQVIQRKITKGVHTYMCNINLFSFQQSIPKTRGFSSWVCKLSPFENVQNFNVLIKMASFVSRRK